MVQAIRQSVVSVLLLVLLVFALTSCATEREFYIYQEAANSNQSTPPLELSGPAAQVFQDAAKLVLASPADSGLHEAIEPYLQAYAALDRSKLSHDELMEVKFSYMNANRVAAQRLVQAASAGLKVVESLETLAKLPILVEEEKLFQLAQALHTNTSALGHEVKSGFARVLATQGDARLVAKVAKQYPALLSDATQGPKAGPLVYVEIGPGHMTKVTLDQTLEGSDLSNYEWLLEGDAASANTITVLYRGLTLRPGDLLLMQQHNDSESLFSAPSDAKSYLYHTGVFVLPKVGDKLYPMVFESYEAGVRLVPLQVWTGREFASYAE